MNDHDEIPVETLAEPDNYSIWLADEPDEELTYHLELGQVTVHFFEEEWDEFVELINQAAEEPIEDDDEGAVEVELDWGSLYFTREEWQEFLRLIREAAEE